MHLKITCVLFLTLLASFVPAGVSSDGATTTTTFKAEPERNATTFMPTSATVSKREAKTFAPISQSELKRVLDKCLHISKTQRVRLARTGPTQRGHKRPPLVLVHGLDSTRFTWTEFINKSPGRWNAIAVDLRGWGQSPMGKEEDYDAKAMAADIEDVLKEEVGDKKVVMVGHSMGGRVAIQYAADFPHRIAALVLEDIDIELDEAKSNWLEVQDFNIHPFDLEARRNCPQVFDNFKNLSAVMGQWYEQSWIDGWLGSGHVFKMPNGTWWCGISPLSNYLSLKSVVCAVGRNEWHIVGQQKFPVRVLVAGKSSIIEPVNLQYMESMVPRTRVVRFPQAFHSIHNTKLQDFTRAIREVYEELEKRPSKPKSGKKKKK